MRKLKTQKWMGLLGLALLFAVVGTPELSAQRRMRDRPFANPNPTRRAERFDMLMKLKLVEALDLSSEQGDKFLPVFNQYRQKTQRLLRARGELMQDLTRHVRIRMGALEEGEEEGELSERELKDRLARLGELRRQQEANRDEFYQNAGHTLSTEQLTRLIVFEERFAREIVRNLPNP
ncbi:MAG TPA: hypothetical protein VI546_00670 [candidate division Zixibacteria bacterium]|nr:hypothetical protein [candidate division Zixibacteria bacterium]